MKNQIKVGNMPEESISKIITSLNSNQIVTIPTETVEGYAVSIKSITAIKNLMKLKDRSFESGKVFTLVPESIDAIEKYVVLPEKAKSLIETHFPGELTIILNKNPDFHHFYFDHFTSVGIRIPNHPLFEKILPATGALLLTSANKKGGTPKSITGHLPSTIVDFTKKTPEIIRQGNLDIKPML